MASIGICFAIALLAQAFGYSVALGAFIAGSLVAESGEEEQHRQAGRAGPRHVRGHLLRVRRHAHRSGAGRALLAGRSRADRRRRRRQGVRCVARGLLERHRAAHLGAGRHEPGADRRVLVHHRRARARAGRDGRISVPSRGRRLGADDAIHTVADPRLGPGRDLGRPEVAAVPADIRVPLRKLGRGPGLSTADHQLHGSCPATASPAWCSTGHCLQGSSSRRPLESASMAGFVREKTGSSETVAQALVVIAAITLAAPFCVGVIRVSRKLGVTLAKAALPVHKGRRVDFAAAPRRALVVTLQLAGVMLDRRAPRRTHPAVPAGRSHRRRAGPDARRARGRVLAQHHQPPGARPRGRRSHSPGDRRAIA